MPQFRFFFPSPEDTLDASSVVPPFCTTTAAFCAGETAGGLPFLCLIVRQLGGGHASAGKPRRAKGEGGNALDVVKLANVPDDLNHKLPIHDHRQHKARRDDFLRPRLA